MSHTEKKIWLVLLLLGVAINLGGCSFKVEALYHGRTPIGVDDRKATVLQSQTEPRTIRARD